MRWSVLPRIPCVCSYGGRAPLNIPQVCRSPVGPSIPPQWGAFVLPRIPCVCRYRLDWYGGGTRKYPPSVQVTCGHPFPPIEVPVCVCWCVAVCRHSAGGCVGTCSMSFVLSVLSWVYCSPRQVITTPCNSFHRQWQLLQLLDSARYSSRYVRRHWDASQTVSVGGGGGHTSQLYANYHWLSDQVTQYYNRAVPAANTYCPTGVITIIVRCYISTSFFMPKEALRLNIATLCYDSGSFYKTFSIFLLYNEHCDLWSFA